MRAIVWGADGHMGQLVCQELAAKGHEVCGRVDVKRQGLEPGDVIIDFSSPDSIEDLLAYAVETSTPAVIATTGHSPEQLSQIDEASSQVAILHSANMSVGMNLLFAVVEHVARVLLDSDVEIVETHHRRKKDAPSGSAVSLAAAVEKGIGERRRVYGRHGQAPRQNGEIGVHAIRGGDIVGKHEVHFFGDNETVTLSHTAHDRRIFAAGAVRAAEFLINKPAGKYTMADVLQLGNGLQLTRA